MSTDIGHTANITYNIVRLCRTLDTKSVTPNYSFSRTRQQQSASISCKKLASLSGGLGNIIKIPQFSSKTVEQIDDNVPRIEEYISTLCTWFTRYPGTVPKAHGSKQFSRLAPDLNKV